VSDGVHTDGTGGSGGGGGACDPGFVLPSAAAQAMAASESWRVFRIMAEFVTGFETMARLPPAVTIFGSARTPTDHPDYTQAEELARRLGAKGLAIITGGGPGVMEAANKGAKAAGACSVGLNIALPHEQKPNPFQTHELLFEYFFVRKVMFMKYARAFVIFPGGFGTLDEFFESLTLIQTLKIEPFPVVLVGSAFWSGLLDWMREALAERWQTIGVSDLDLFRVTDDIGEVVSIVERSLRGEAMVPGQETTIPGHAGELTGEGTRAGINPRAPLLHDPDRPEV